MDLTEKGKEVLADRIMQALRENLLEIIRQPFTEEKIRSRVLEVIKRTLSTDSPLLLSDLRDCHNPALDVLEEMDIQIEQIQDTFLITLKRK